VHACSCGPGLVDRYHARISAPLLDRIDIHLRVPAVPYAERAGRAGPAKLGHSKPGRGGAGKAAGAVLWQGRAACQRPHGLTGSAEALPPDAGEKAPLDHSGCRTGKA
jgi:hypothetical protein